MDFTVEQKLRLREAQVNALLHRNAMLQARVEFLEAEQRAAAAEVAFNQAVREETPDGWMIPWPDLRLMPMLQVEEGALDGIQRDDGV